MKNKLFAFNQGLPSGLAQGSNDAVGELALAIKRVGFVRVRARVVGVGGYRRRRRPRERR